MTKKIANRNIPYKIEWEVLRCSHYELECQAREGER